MTKEIYKYPYNARTEDEIKVFLSDKICEQVVKVNYRNGQIFCTIKDRITSENKEIILSAAILFGVLFAMPYKAEAIGVSPILPSAPEIHRPALQTVPQHAPIINPRLDKIRFVKPSELPLWIYIMDEQFIRTPKVSKLIKELRGGSLTTALIGNAIVLAVLYGIWILGGGTQGFLTPPTNPGWGLPRGLYDTPGLVRPGDCGTQLHAGSPSQSLKTWEDRNQPNPKDRWFLVESRPELVMRRGQSKFKTKDHGALAGLPYSVKKNGSTSTLKTEENVDIFMDVVEEIVYDPNTLWFEEATYQGGTDRELESINLYSEKHNRIAVFLRSTGEFITFCEPTLNELEDLSQTANFGGQDNWFSSTPKNMPPKQDFVSDFTPVNSFESDVMGITPISSIDENSSPNQGFTPLNSFESDVLGITPVDPDWQI
jgi:hypothetical protein